jgi:valyl-tRNA synthetase
MAWVPELTILQAPAEKPRGTVSALAAGAELCLHIGSAVDVASELARLDKQIAKARQDVERSEKKLANEGFRQKAPGNVIAEEQERLQESRSLVEKLGRQRQSLEQLGA